MKSSLKKVMRLAACTFLTMTLFATGCSKDKNGDQDQMSENSSINETKTTASSVNDGININIKYIGNSCFYITFADGTKIVTDPYPQEMDNIFGAFPSDIKADVVTVSHMHSDHTAANRVGGNPKSMLLCEAEKGAKIGDVNITAYNAKHVADMGDNTIFIYEENGYKIVNLGETDTIPSEEVRKVMKGADVVLAYAGEYGKVKNADLYKELEKLDIPVMIPEHYSMSSEHVFYGEPTIETILTEIPESYKAENANEYIVTKNKAKKFVVLSYTDKIQ